MSESFEQLLNQESFSNLDLRSGTIFNGEVIGIDKNKGLVVIDTPFKSEGYIRIEEFLDKDGKLEIALGDKVPVSLESFEEGKGETNLSRQRAKRHAVWINLEKAYETAESVTGVICGKVKGGFTVDIDGIRAFLPGSLVDVRPVKDTSHLEGIDLEFKVIKLDQKRNNVVISRRSIVEAENSVEKEEILSRITEAQIVKGIVKNLTDYGAFVDLGGIDGLLHITDIAWKRVKHPSEMLTVGQEIEVKVLSFDQEKMRVSLGLKQTGGDPWQGVAERYPEKAKITGKVTNIADYGCFVELEEGIEGLVHVSEMDWTNKNVNPSKLVELGQEIEVVVLEIDESRRRISLGLKQCQPSPWVLFAQQNVTGDKIEGKIKSITDFGIFIGLEGGIDGLVHLSDISWDTAGEEAVKAYKKGDTVEAVVLAVDADRERISLGIKQIGGDPFAEYVGNHDKGSIVNGVVKEVDAKAAIVTLTEGVEATLKAADISNTEKVTDASNKLSVGDAVEAKIVNVDKKARTITISIRAKEVQENAEAIEEYGSNNETSSTLGDLMDAEKNKEGNEDK